MQATRTRNKKRGKKERGRWVAKHRLRVAGRAPLPVRRMGREQGNQRTRSTSTISTPKSVILVRKLQTKTTRCFFCGSFVQIMASSLNGLTVGDSHIAPETLMESPARDEMCSECSLMSEDSDDSRYCDTPLATSQSDVVSSPTSPVSPQRHQKMVGGLSSTTNPYPLPGCTVASVVCSHSRQRGSDSEVRFPSSPNDMCHTADLRKAALLRSVQMRAQPQCSPAYELPFNNGQENIQCDEGEDGAYSEIKNPVDDEVEYERVSELLVECSSENCPSKIKLGCEGKCAGVKYDAERERMQ